MENGFNLQLIKRQDFIHNLYASRQSGHPDDTKQAWPSLGCYLKDDFQKALFAIEDFHFPCQPAFNIHLNMSFEVVEDLYYRWAVNIWDYMLLVCLFSLTYSYDFVQISTQH